MRSCRRLMGFSAFAVALLGAATADAAPTLVELFTSQSCSSCPPADRLLGELAARPDLLALSFHVDYWDNLGWKDPYSASWATERQRHYARLLRAEIYTPQLVVDGRAETVGSDRDGVEALLRQSHAATIPATIRDTAGGFDITIGGAAAPAAADILLVTYDTTHQTPIRGGENSGRFLQTYNDVRSLRSIGRWSGVPVSLTPARQPGDAGEHAAVLVQADDGRIWAVAAAVIGVTD